MLAGYGKADCRKDAILTICVIKKSELKKAYNLTPHVKDFMLNDLQFLETFTLLNIKSNLYFTYTIILCSEKPVLVNLLPFLYVVDLCFATFEMPLKARVNMFSL